MHRMNANRVTNGGTSTIGDASMSRIRQRVDAAQERRANKRAGVKKTASIENEPQHDKDLTTSRIVIASLNEVPQDFERIGTGFYRQGHAVWEMMPGEGGFVLVRKQGEDHVLGYSPEPISKAASITVTDRNGHELRLGSKVRFPHRGKIATGTIIVLSPSALGLDMGEGKNVDMPSDIVEWAEEEAAESEHEGTGEALVEFAEEETKEPAHQGDKAAGDEFEPAISDKPKSDFVGPASAQVGSGGIGAANENEGGRNVLAARTAQTAPEAPPAGAPPADAASPVDMADAPTPQRPYSRMLDATEEGPVGVLSETGEGPYLVTKMGDNQYKIEIIRTQKLQGSTVDQNGLMQFEQQLGRWAEMPAYSMLARKASREICLSMMKALADQPRIGSALNTSTWKAYWTAVGQRVAAGPPKPKMTETEKKQKAKDRRDRLKKERGGLPPNAFKQPKKSAVGSDELAKLKEYNQLLESAVEGIAYAIESVDHENDTLVADAVAQEIERFQREKEEMEKKNQDVQVDELSLKAPSQAELDGIDITRTSTKIVVSMDDLVR